MLFRSVRGRIILYNRRGGIRSEDNELLETGVRIDVEAFLLVDGQEVRKARASAAVGYIVGDPDNETEARNRALRRLSEELVLTLLAPAD